MININKSYRLSRFNLAVVLCIIAILTGVFLRYFDIIQASIEEVSVEINLLNMKQMIHAQNFISEKKDTQCKLLDDPNLFPTIDLSGKEAGKQQMVPGTWQYDAQKHQITYSVRSKHFFRSELGQKIVIDLYCKDGRVLFVQNKFQWCRDKKIWGCIAW